MGQHDASVTIKLSELDDLRDEVRRSEKRAQDAEERLQAAAASGANGHLVKALTDAVDVALFGIGNLPPEAVRGWPHATVRRLGEILPALHELPERLREIGPDIVHRAAEMANIEEIRRKRDLSRGIASNIVDEDD